MMYTPMEARIIAEAANLELSARTARRHYGGTPIAAPKHAVRMPIQAQRSPRRERFGETMATLRAWQVRAPRMTPRQA